MKSIRTAVAGMTLAIAAPAMLAACGSQPASPAAGPSPSSMPSATATASPPATPAPTQVPGSGSTSPAPSIRVVSSRIAYPWHWPNDPAGPGRVTHAYAVPPVPELVQISVGNHSEEHGQLPYNRMSFTFTTAFPNYHFEWVGKLVSDVSGQVVSLHGTDVLKIVFTKAQAHTADGARSTIVSQPGRPIGYPFMNDFAQAGDFEGVLTYGIGVTRPVLHSNPQTMVRAYEVEVVTATGQHRYVVAIDIDGSHHG
ncbi:MAG: AMIN-like domain-containing (lipo)protein [Streptosporangiaceae bacterium]